MYTWNKSSETGRCCCCSWPFHIFKGKAEGGTKSRLERKQVQKPLQTAPLSCPWAGRFGSDDWWGGWGGGGGLIMESGDEDILDVLRSRYETGLWCQIGSIHPRRHYAVTGQKWSKNVLSVEMTQTGRRGQTFAKKNKQPRKHWLCFSTCQADKVTASTPSLIFKVIRQIRHRRPRKLK